MPITTPLTRQTLVLALTCWAPALYANDSVTLASTQIQASDFNDSTELSRQRLNQVAGATSLISHDNLSARAQTNMAEALGFIPGVYAQSAGNEGLRLSIRGSGVNRASGAHGSGVFVLLDGLPLTGPGGTPYELQEPLWLERIELYRGANGIEQGALGLGGAINLVSPTGHHAAPLTLRYEAGSYGWQKRYLSSGGVSGPVDYFVALTDSDYDGYQRHSSGDSRGLMANVGYQFNEALSTRFYLRYRETEHQTPGRITREQIEHDPRAAHADNLNWNSHRPQPGSTWLANKTTWAIDGARTLELGLAWHHYPMDLHESRNRLKLDYEDLISSVSYNHKHQLFNRDSETKLLLRSTLDLPNKGARESVRIARTIDDTFYDSGSKTRDYEHNGKDALLQLSNSLVLTPALWLDTSTGLTYFRREVEVTSPAQDKAVNSQDYDYTAKIGLRYAPNPSTTLFANLSRSVEPAHPWSMLWSSGSKFPQGSGAATGSIRQGIELKSQTATSLEIGGRGAHPLGLWEAAYYYAKVRNAHLPVELMDASGAPYTAEANASPTIHQGVELALDSSLGEALHGEWRLRQAYTLNHLRYRNDDAFGDNYLPGIPKHRYQAELKYIHLNGWYLAANTELSSRIATDYANSFYAGSYTLLGARAGFSTQDQRLSLWLEGRNLTNERYAATVVPGYNDQGQDRPRSSPGEGRGFYTGISYQWQ